MTVPTDPASARARIEARALLHRLTGSNRRDRVAFTFGYILAVDSMLAVLPPEEGARMKARAQALHTLCDMEF